MRTHIHTYVRTHPHTRIHTHRHTYIRTYIHTFLVAVHVAGHPGIMGAAAASRGAEADIDAEEAVGETRVGGLWGASALEREELYALEPPVQKVDDSSICI